jgi:hypothetical protein
MVELAWTWLRWQPDSALSVWFRARVGAMGGRIKKVLIVALARKLLVALSRYVKDGVIPDGARMRRWVRQIRFSPWTSRERPRVITEGRLALRLNANQRRCSLLSPINSAPSLPHHRPFLTVEHRPVLGPYGLSRRRFELT